MTTMTLNDLLMPWLNNGVADCDITGLCNDSRVIQPGSLFFAYPGAQFDGRDYIAKALQSGAGAVVYESKGAPPLSYKKDICIPIDGLDKKLAAIAGRFYGEPTQQLNFTGVTGTNGKTTIAYQLAQAYELMGQSAAYIGTLGQGKPFTLQSLHNTTPDALVLQSLFDQYHRKAIKQVCMEVSSHALSQARVDHIPFQQAIFTNLTHDHLDYHKTMEAYAAAKALLFAVPSLRHAIINSDDPYAQLMSSKVVPSCEVITYGIHESADVRALFWQVTMQGIIIEVRTPWGLLTLTIQALGFFNLYNALAILSSLLAAGNPAADVVNIMAKLQPAPGRMEVIQQSPTVIVDYAHTPDALENVLVTLSKVKIAKLFVLFGCGGDRDRRKRPIMGKIASQHADVVFLTSDNPRHEEPEQIIAEIKAGILPHAVMECIVDRKAAIARALSLAGKNDIVVIAGKGHENYQQIGDERFPFSDQDVIRDIINRH